SMGFKFTEESSDQISTFNFQLDGYNVTLLNNFKDLQLFLGFSDKIPATKINEWNRRYRFSRAYVVDDDSVRLVADLNLKGGVTKQTIEEFIKLFGASVTPYVDFVANQNANPTKGEPGSGSYQKSPSAKARVGAPFGNFALWIDETK